MSPRLLATIAALSLAASSAWAQSDQPMMAKDQSGVAVGEHFDAGMCHPDGIAIGGYDLVSYRAASGPIMGIAEFEYEHQGVSYRFANGENLEAFKARPDYYLPAYSGFCAITLALGRVTCPDFTNYKIENDQLLLFEVTGFTNGRTLWNSDVDTFRTQADDNFKLIRDL